jgi:8-oxo-dGTP diphosphatase
MNTTIGTRAGTAKRLIKNNLFTGSNPILSRKKQFIAGMLRSTSDMHIKKLPVTVTWLDPAEADTIDPAAVWGVGVIPFTEDGDVVVVRLRRGIEIPAGGIEPQDLDFEATARREAWEEARITLGELELAQVAQVDRVDADEPARYLVFYAGTVRSMPPFEQHCESFERLVVSCEEFVEKDGFGPYSPAADRYRMISEAKSAVRRMFRRSRTFTIAV